MNFFVFLFEHIKSFLFFNRIKPPCVAILGSARFGPDNIYYQKSYDIAAKLAKQSIAIVTGGGYSVMEAANKGAQSGGALSVGLYINAQPKEPMNAFLDKTLTFQNPLSRKITLVHYSKAFILFPGGFGTLDELLELLVLCQNKRLKKPILLIGIAFWEPLLHYFKDTLLKEKVISREDLDYLYMTDSVDDAVKRIITEVL